MNRAAAIDAILACSQDRTPGAAERLRTGLDNLDDAALAKLAGGLAQLAASSQQADAEAAVRTAAPFILAARAGVGDWSQVTADWPEETAQANGSQATSGEAGAADGPETFAERLARIGQLTEGRNSFGGRMEYLVDLQNAFDERMARIRQEGSRAQAAGTPKEDCPHPPGTQERTAWIGGWAEASLGILDDMPQAPPTTP